MCICGDSSYVTVVNGFLEPVIGHNEALTEAAPTPKQKLGVFRRRERSLEPLARERQHRLLTVFTHRL